MVLTLLINRKVVYSDHMCSVLEFFVGNVEPASCFGISRDIPCSAQPAILSTNSGDKNISKLLPNSQNHSTYVHKFQHKNSVLGNNATSYYDIQYEWVM